MNWEGIFQFFGITSAAGLVLGYLGKLAIQKFSEGALKTFQHNLELQKIQAQNQFDLLRIEKQVRFSRMHEEQSEVLKSLYNELLQLEIDLQQYTSIFQGPEWSQDSERYQNALKQLKRCRHFLEKSLIFLPQAVCDEVDASLAQAGDIMNEMEKAKIQDVMMKEAASRGERMEVARDEFPLTKWREQEKRVLTEIRGNRKKLAKGFRKLLGVTDVFEERETPSE